MNWLKRENYVKFAHSFDTAVKENQYLFIKLMEEYNNISG